MKQEQIEALRSAAADGLRFDGKPIDRHATSFLVLRLIAERDALLLAVRSERDRAKARVEAGIESECECSVCEQLAAALALAES